MLVLGEYEKCPHGKICPNIRDEASDNNLCQGLNPLRKNSFKCEFIEQDEWMKKSEPRIENRSPYFR